MLTVGVAEQIRENQSVNAFTALSMTLTAPFRLTGTLHHDSWCYLTFRVCHKYLTFKNDSLFMFVMGTNESCEYS